MDEIKKFNSLTFNLNVYLQFLTMILNIFNLKPRLKLRVEIKLIQIELSKTAILTTY